MIKILIATATILFSIVNDTAAQQLTKIQKWEQPSYFKGFNIGLWCSENDCEKTQEDINSLKKMAASSFNSISFMQIPNSNKADSFSGSSTSDSFKTSSA